RRFEANGFDGDAIEVVPHGVEFDALPSARPEPSGRRPGPTRLAFVGSLVRFKGAHVVVDALASVPDLDVELVVYGAGPERDDLDRRSASDRRVRMAGTFPPHEMTAVLRDTDYLVMPSLWFE